MPRTAESSARICSMEGEYSLEWAELRRLRRRVFNVVLAGASVFLLMQLTAGLAPHGVAEPFGFALFAAWVLLLVKFFLAAGLR
jgi:hypothetical protein